MIWFKETPPALLLMVLKRVVPLRSLELCCARMGEGDRPSVLMSAMGHSCVLGKSCAYTLSKKMVSQTSSTKSMMRDPTGVWGVKMGVFGDDDEQEEREKEKK